MNSPADDGFLHACVLDGKGSSRELQPGDVDAWSSTDGTLWLHLDFSKGGTQEWLERIVLPEVVVDALTYNESRPRSLEMQDGMLVILRGVNMNPGEDPEDMVSIRIWIEQDRIITTRRRRLLAIQDIRDKLAEGEGPVRSSDFLVELIGRLADRIGAFIDRIEARLEQAEDLLVDDQTMPDRRPLAEARRQIANVRRFIAPQRDALDRLYRYATRHFSEDDIHDLREEADRITRYVEDLDLARERAVVLQEEYQSLLAQQQNSRMYVLSIVAAIFLPLTFVTGLLGMNVGGLPGVETDFGFVGAVVVMLVCTVIAALVLRWKRWM